MDEEIVIRSYETDTFKHLSVKESESLIDFAAGLYVKGLRLKDAKEMIKNEALSQFNQPLKDTTCQEYFYNGRNKYLATVKMLSTENSMKDAILEIESLEDKIDLNLKPSAGKYQTILDAKKHKHELLGLNKANPILEINIGSDVDIDFLKVQNEE